MFYLTGTAASSALDIIATLQQTLGASSTGSTQAPTSAFDTATAVPASTSGTSGGSTTTSSDATTPTSLLAPTTLDALLAVQGQGQSPVVNGDAFSQQLFSLLDTNGDGSISQSEFDAAFGQNGDTAQANALFNQISGGGSSISQQQLTNAIDGQDQTQGLGQTQGAQGHHHHHHGGGGGFDIASLIGGASGAGGAGSTGSDGSSSTDPVAALMGTSQSVTNSDGSTTTTISYADGSQVSMTVPAASNGSSSNGTSGSGNSSNSSSSLSNYIEQMIERQAQMLASSVAGQGLSVSV